MVHSANAVQHTRPTPAPPLQRPLIRRSHFPNGWSFFQNRMTLVKPPPRVKDCFKILERTLAELFLERCMKDAKPVLVRADRQHVESNRSATGRRSQRSRNPSRPTVRSPGDNTSAQINPELLRAGTSRSPYGKYHLGRRQAVGPRPVPGRS
jgi:hypothetical protein